MTRVPFGVMSNQSASDNGSVTHFDEIKRKSISFIETDKTEEDVEGNFRTYKQRWAVLGSLSLLIFSNSLSRLAFGPVAYTSAVFYDTQVSTINWFAIVYMVVGIPVGIVVTWFMDKVGMRWALLSAAWINCLGSVLRVASALGGVGHTWRLVLVFAGHVLSAIAQPVFMFSPTKVAAVWFPESQRAIANTLSTLCNPLGVLIANLFSPMLVKVPSDVLMMTIAYVVPAGLGALVTSAFVRSNAPPTAPSASADRSSETFWMGIKSLFYNRHYWILFVTVGGAVGIYTAITVFLEQILCPWGYSDFYAGVIGGSCLVLGGVLGAVVSGILADRTKQFSTIAKLSFVLCTLAILFFSLVQNRPGNAVLVGLSLALVGFFGMPLLPLGNELIVETTYPVEPASSSGLVFMSGQLQGMLIILILQEVAFPLSEDSIATAKCLTNHDPNNPSRNISDMTTSCWVLFGYACFVCLGFVALFRNTSRRINLERQQKQKQLPNSSSQMPKSGERQDHNKDEPSGGSDCESTSSSQQRIISEEGTPTTNDT